MAHLECRNPRNASRPRNRPAITIAYPTYTAIVETVHQRVEVSGGSRVLPAVRRDCSGTKDRVAPVRAPFDQDHERDARISRSG